MPSFEDFNLIHFGLLLITNGFMFFCLFKLAPSMFPMKDYIREDMDTSFIFVYPFISFITMIGTSQGKEVALAGGIFFFFYFFWTKARLKEMKGGENDTL